VRFQAIRDELKGFRVAERDVAVSADEHYRRAWNAFEPFKMGVRDVAVAKLAVAFSPPFNLSLKGDLTIHATVEATDERIPRFCASIHA
jgi:hypothetical protein